MQLHSATKNETKSLNDDVLSLCFSVSFFFFFWNEGVPKPPAHRILQNRVTKKKVFASLRTPWYACGGNKRTLHCHHYRIMILFCICDFLYSNLRHLPQFFVSMCVCLCFSSSFTQMHFLKSFVQGLMVCEIF